MHKAVIHSGTISSFNAVDFGDIFTSRMTADGTLDISFGLAGTRVLDVNQNGEVLSGLAIDSQQRVLLGISTFDTDGYSRSWRSARLVSSGELDMTFGNAGIQNVSISSISVLVGMGVDILDRIYLVGSVKNPAPAGWDATTVRLLGNPNQPPVAVAGGPYVVYEGAPLHLLGYNSSDDTGLAKLKFEWDLDYKDGEFTSDGSGVDLPIDASDDISLRTIALRVTDPFGLESISTTELAVRNVAPEISFLSGPDNNRVRGEMLSFSVGFVDPGVRDTYVFDWSVSRDGVGYATTSGQPLSTS